MNVVTGAFGYIGRTIARRLLESGQEVVTVTTHPDKPNPFGDEVAAHPYNFDRPDQLEASLRGASTLYNTYWIRFPYRGATFEKAVRNTRILFESAKRAGIEKIVHISVTNASLDSDLPYYRGKALQEKALRESGIPFAIVRASLVFGKEDILVNNVAWLIRRFPIFPIFGSGKYKLQPIHVADLAEIAVESAGKTNSIVLDAIGPEAYTFDQFVRLIAAEIKPSVKLIHVPPAFGIALGKLIGATVRDVILTDDELRGLMENALTSEQAPNGTTRFSEWIEIHKDTVGTAYSSELDRHFRWHPRPD